MVDQAYADLFCAEQESQHIHSLQPVRLIPSVVWDKNRMSADWPNRFCAARAGNVHGVTASKGDRKSREICHISKRGWDGTAVREIQMANSRLVKISFEFTHDDLAR